MISDMKYVKFIVVMSVMTLFASVLADQPIMDPGPGVRYATDAYPGFDLEFDNIKPEKKEPRFFGWFNGPAKADAVEQFSFCEELEKAGEISKARKGYDALVREWSTSPLAPKAQLKVAELALTELDYEDAFEEYRYLLDFFSSSCDFNAICNRMYEVVEMMRAEGKRVFFVRFANTIDVRRAYESLVLRAPGAAFVPTAMLTIAKLRVDEGEREEAVKVLENLRNIHANKPEALEALELEGELRIKLLRAHGYNRARVMDTEAFFRMALAAKLNDETKAKFKEYLKEAEYMHAEEAWNATKFYDSRTRTRRSAIGAYEAFLNDYPGSPRAAEARLRLQQLREGTDSAGAPAGDDAAASTAAPTDQAKSAEAAQ